MSTKTVLITGGVRGIGKAITEIFAKNGYNVIANYINSYDKAIALKNDLSQYNINIYKSDVSYYNDVKNMVEYIENNIGGIDILINNAGIAQQKLFTDISDDDWNKMIGVNLTGVFNCCKAVLPYMIKNKSGKIINISSMWGQVGASCEVHYSAAKAGVIGLTKALAKEVGLSGISVNCICPGVISTDMMNGFSEDDINALKDETPLQCIGSPKDIADMVYFLAKDSTTFITGQIIGVNGGMII